MGLWIYARSLRFRVVSKVYVVPPALCYFINFDGNFHLCFGLFFLAFFRLPLFVRSSLLVVFLLGFDRVSPSCFFLFCLVVIFLKNIGKDFYF